MVSSGVTPRCTAAGSTRSTSCRRSASRSSRLTARPSRWRTRSSTTPELARSVMASSGSSRSTSRSGSAPARSVTKRSDATPLEIRPAWRALVADPALGGLAFGAAASDVVDAWLVGLLGDEPGVVLLAVGAYGRRELCPESDLDLVLIHDGRRNRDLR